MVPTNALPVTVTEQLEGRATQYCRAVLQYFQRHSTRVARVDELVTFIHDQGQLDKDETKIAIHLHHATLPKLADAKLVDYDARSNTTRYRGQRSEA